jgi:polysaccharide biosynthesis/export protein
MRAGRPLLVALTALALAAALAGCMRKPAPRPVAYAQPPAAAQPMTAPLAQPMTDPRQPLQMPPPVVPAPPEAAMAQSPMAGAPMAAAPAVIEEPAYMLDAGDKLRVVVFGQEGLSNSYSVDAAGFITMPLIGAVQAHGRSTTGLSRAIADKLRNGYIREPHVAVEIEAYRPFFILGEVTAPGQYPYVANMTAQTAIAIAGGFTPRADKKTVEVSRSADGQLHRGRVPLAFQIRPGDTVLVRERWF